jgi:hypothetical protein
MYTMNDYNSQSHNVYLNLSYVPTGKLHLYGLLNYNLTSGELDQVEMPDVSARLEGDLTHQDFTFPEIHTYSDLDYQWLRATFGLEFEIAPRTVWTAEVDYLDLTDDSGGWVYGDESGSQLLLRSGVRFDF